MDSVGSDVYNANLAVSNERLRRNALENRGKPLEDDKAAQGGTAAKTEDPKAIKSEREIVQDAVENSAKHLNSMRKRDSLGVVGKLRERVSRDRFEKRVAKQESFEADPTLQRINQAIVEAKTLKSNDRLKVIQTSITGKSGDVKFLANTEKELGGIKRKIVDLKDSIQRHKENIVKLEIEKEHLADKIAMMTPSVGRGLSVGGEHPDRPEFANRTKFMERIKQISEVQNDEAAKVREIGLAIKSTENSLEPITRSMDMLSGGNTKKIAGMLMPMLMTNVYGNVYKDAEEIIRPLGAIGDIEIPAERFVGDLEKKVMDGLDKKLPENVGEGLKGVEVKRGMKEFFKNLTSAARFVESRLSSIEIEKGTTESVPMVKDSWKQLESLFEASAEVASASIGIANDSFYTTPKAVGSLNNKHLVSREDHEAGALVRADLKAQKDSMNNAARVGEVQTFQIATKTDRNTVIVQRAQIQRTRRNIEALRKISITSDTDEALDRLGAKLDTLDGSGKIAGRFMDRDILSFNREAIEVLSEIPQFAKMPVVAKEGFLISDKTHTAKMLEYVKSTKQAMKRVAGYEPDSRVKDVSRWTNTQSVQIKQKLLEGLEGIVQEAVDSGVAHVEVDAQNTALLIKLLSRTEVASGKSAKALLDRAVSTPVEHDNDDDQDAKTAFFKVSIEDAKALSEMALKSIKADAGSYANVPKWKRSERVTDYAARFLDGQEEGPMLVQGNVRAVQTALSQLNKIVNIEFGHRPELHGYSGAKRAKEIRQIIKNSGMTFDDSVNMSFVEEYLEKHLEADFPTLQKDLTKSMMSSSSTLTRNQIAQFQMQIDDVVKGYSEQVIKNIAATAYENGAIKYSGDGNEKLLGKMTDSLRKYLKVSLTHDMIGSAGKGKSVADAFGSALRMRTYQWAENNAANNKLTFPMNGPNGTVLYKGFRPFAHGFSTQANHHISLATNAINNSPKMQSSMVNLINHFTGSKADKFENIRESDLVFRPAEKEQSVEFEEEEEESGEARFDVEDTTDDEDDGDLTEPEMEGDDYSDRMERGFKAFSATRRGTEEEEFEVVDRPKSDETIDQQGKDPKSDIDTEDEDDYVKLNEDDFDEYHSSEELDEDKVGGKDKQSVGKEEPYFQDAQEDVQNDEGEEPPKTPKKGKMIRSSLPGLNKDMDTHEDEMERMGDELKTPIAPSWSQEEKLREKNPESQGASPKKQMTLGEQAAAAGAAKKSGDSSSSEDSGFASTSDASTSEDEATEAKKSLREPDEDDDYDDYFDVKDTLEGEDSDIDTLAKESSSDPENNPIQKDGDNKPLKRKMGVKKKKRSSAVPNSEGEVASAPESTSDTDAPKPDAKTERETAEPEPKKASPQKEKPIKDEVKQDSKDKKTFARTARAATEEKLEIRKREEKQRKLEMRKERKEESRLAKQALKEKSKADARLKNAAKANAYLREKDSKLEAKKFNQEEKERKIVNKEAAKNRKILDKKTAKEKEAAEKKAAKEKDLAEKKAKPESKGFFGNFWGRLGFGGKKTDTPAPANSESEEDLEEISPYAERRPFARAMPNTDTSSDEEYKSDSKGDSVYATVGPRTPKTPKDKTPKSEPSEPTEPPRGYRGASNPGPVFDSSEDEEFPELQKYTNKDLPKDDPPKKPARSLRHEEDDSEDEDDFEWAGGIKPPKRDGVESEGDNSKNPPARPPRSDKKDGEKQTTGRTPVPAPRNKPPRSEEKPKDSTSERRKIIYSDDDDDTFGTFAGSGLPEP